MEFVRLNNDVLIPQVGYGVYKVPNEEITASVLTAFEAGYRSIDTAQFYQNEAGLGEAIRQSGIPRKDLFITSKVWNSHHGTDRTVQAFEASLEQLGLEYLDLYLVHWPVPVLDKYIETYQAMEQLYKDGRIRAIGVSNFHIQHLQRLLDVCDIIPTVNQVECHPYLQQQELKAFCKQHGIYVESWSPLYRGGEVLQETSILQIAEKHQKTPAQIILRWHLQEDSIIIPKSVTPVRIHENIGLFDFELDEEDIGAIRNLNKDVRIGKDPDDMNIIDQ